MCNRAMKWVRNIKGIGHSAKFVLVALCDFANKDNGSCFPSVPCLADYTEQSEDTVSRRLAELRAAGLIYTMRRYRKGGGRISNEYVVLHDEIARQYAHGFGWVDDSQETERKPSERNLAEASQTARVSTPPTELNASGPVCRPDAPRHRAANCGPVNHHNPHSAPALTRNQTGYINEPSLGTTTLLPPNPPTEPQKKASERVPTKTNALQEKAVEELFQEFMKLWPRAERDRLDRARAAFRKLNACERILAFKYAPKYLAACKAKGVLRCGIHTWLDQGGWLGPMSAEKQKIEAQIRVVELRRDSEAVFAPRLSSGLRGFGIR
jgi:GntR family transcriptional regulator